MMSLISSSVCEGDFSSERKDFEALAGLVEAPVMVEADGFESAEGLKAIYFDGLDYKGKPTKVFAWLGMPENTKGKVPGWSQCGPCYGVGPRWWRHGV